MSSTRYTAYCYSSQMVLAATNNGKQSLLDIARPTGTTNLIGVSEKQFTTREWKFMAATGLARNATLVIGFDQDTPYYWTTVHPSLPHTTQQRRKV